MKRADDLEPVLREFYASSGPRGEELSHPRDLELTAYLEGRLPAPARDRLEAHLAVCEPCRELVRISAEALPSAAEGDAGREAEEALAAAAGRRRRARAWAGARPLWRIAAVLAVALGGLLLLQARSGEHGAGLETLGVTAADLARRGPQEAAQIRRAAAGQWPGISRLDPFRPAARERALRTASTARAAIPLAPRWSAVRSPRPEFRWFQAAGAEATELLVVDQEERPVLHVELPGEGPHGGGRGHLPFPEDAAPLEPGGTYFWKLNSRRAGGWVASEYVPFYVLSREETQDLVASLAGEAPAPFLQAVALARSGLFWEASDALAGLSATVPGESLRPLLTSLLKGMHLPPEIVEGEVAGRLGGPEGASGGSR